MSGNQKKSSKSSTGSRQSGSRQSGSAKSGASAAGRHNKIYRTPPTPPPEDLTALERGFVADNVAVSSISLDYSRTNPKLGPVIPPFNSQYCAHSKDYFRFHGVDRTLRKTGQLDNKGCSIEGVPSDRFYQSGAGFQYLNYRNQSGAGHSRDQYAGHASFMSELKPLLGYNGLYGYRRNVPWLRATPSPFGTGSRSPTH